MARKASIFVLLFWLRLNETHSNSNKSWEQKQCLQLYGLSPLGDGGIPLTKLHWDNHRITLMSKDVIDNPVLSWPEPIQERKSIKEFFTSLDSHKSNVSSSMLNYRSKNKVWRYIKGRDLIDTATLNNGFYLNGVYAILDELHRCIYISNLKAGSTTISDLMMGVKRIPGERRYFKQKNTWVVKDCFNNPTKQEYQAISNKLKATLLRVEERECPNESCEVTCLGGQLQVSDLPDEILSQYLVFSFVRDPMSRVVSSYHQATHGKEPFQSQLNGDGKLSLNVHYRGQSMQLLNIQSKSGSRIEFDFIGKIENFEYDWNRLQYAMSDKAVTLSPAERAALIPPPLNDSRTAPLFQQRTRISQGRQFFLPVKNSAENKLKSFRGDITSQFPANKGEEHLSNHQPGSVDIEYLPYTIQQELGVCRRYLQDFICFDYPIPSSCVEYANEVY